MKQIAALVGVALLAAIGSAQARSGDDSTTTEQKLTHAKHVDETGDPEELAAERTMYERYNQQQDTWFEDGDFPTIISSLQFEVKEWPQDYESVTSLGWMLGNVERYDEELATYLDYHQAFPNEPESAFPLGDFYFRKKSYVLAANILAPSILMDKKPHPNSFRLLAHSYEKMGLWDQSLKVWDAYLAINPKDQAAIANRKKVAAKLAGGRP